MQGIAVSETEKEVNAFPATPVTVLINIGACSINFCRFSKSSRRKPREPLEILAEILAITRGYWMELFH